MQIEITFNSQDVHGALPKELSTCLFRVLQEVLHNAVKHSRTKRIWVSLRATGKDIHLVIRDSGVGFDVRTASRGAGLGLTSIRERVRLENGTVVVKSKRGTGTTIHACLPCKPIRPLAANTARPLRKR
jgi:signal transduction histidine kinase